MRVSIAVLCGILTSCASLSPVIKTDSQPSGENQAPPSQGKTGTVMKDWADAGALVVTTEVIDRLGARSFKIAYTFQLFVEPVGDLFRPSHVDIRGLIPRLASNSTSGIPGDSTVDIGDYIADGYFLTQWLPYDYLVDSAGNFVRFYSPFAVEGIQEFRKAGQRNRLVQKFPTFFRHAFQENDLIFESAADANLLYQPRARQSQNYGVTFSPSASGFPVICDTVSDSETQVILKGKQIVSKKTELGNDYQCEVSLTYSYDTLGNIPNRIESHENYTSTENGGVLATRDILITIAKRNF